MQQDSQVPLSHSVPHSLDTLVLSEQQAQAIAQLLGQSAPVQVAEVTQHNHVWRLQCGDELFFLKTYTKEWYGDWNGDGVPLTEYCVRHELDAYALLARSGLPTVEVALARLDCDNPLGRPFLVTRALRGLSLNQHLAQAGARQFDQLLEVTGDYLRQIHALTFDYPGYILGNGPVAAPDPNQWQHPAWGAAVCQHSALSMLERDRHRLSPALAGELQEIFASVEERLTPAYRPLRFVQTNMHTHQFFLEPRADSFEVTGVLDMEVASAGGALVDLVAFALEMAAFHPASTRWWQPFFRGYGAEPDFELFRLQMLTFGEESFKCFGTAYWVGSRQEILTRLLAARDWMMLFTT